MSFSLFGYKYSLYYISSRPSLLDSYSVFQVLWEVRGLELVLHLAVGKLRPE